MLDSFTETWDAWLQDRLITSQQRLQNYWLETYLTSPLWRFALSPGMIDDNAWTGVIMPSVDSVNRHFPLPYPLPATTDLVHLATEHQHWFALDERLDLAAFDASIDELYSQTPPLHPTCPYTPTATPCVFYRPPPTSCPKPCPAS